MTPTDVINGAETLLSHPYRWKKYGFRGINKFDQRTYCLSAALGEFFDNGLPYGPSDRDQAVYRAQEHVSDAIKVHLGIDNSISLVGFNDAVGTEFEDVRAVLDIAKERSRGETWAPSVWERE